MTVDGVFNFGAGPGVLPRECLERAQSELLDFQGTGMSVMEISHRSPEFENVLDRASANIRSLLQLPEDMHVLFVQGGASNQFSAVLFNLLPDLHEGVSTVDYLVTGTWSEKAHGEAVKLIGSDRANLIASSKPTNHAGLQLDQTFKWSQKPAFMYYCENETVHGVEFSGGIASELLGAPYSCEDVPIVCDMSSNILSRPIPYIHKLSLVIAGAQKNLGPAGLTIVLVRDSLLEMHRRRAHKHHIPVMMDYYICQSNNSLYNTPPVFSIYMAGLVLEWIRENGGLKWIETRNSEKSRTVYECINSSGGFYRCPVIANMQSRMNVPFRIFKNDNAAPELERDFLAGAGERKLLQLAGHRSVGGIRASLYNALELTAVEELVKFMKDFQQRASR